MSQTRMGKRKAGGAVLPIVEGMEHIASDDSPPYEEMRKRNMSRNNEILTSLNIPIVSPMPAKRAKVRQESSKTVGSSIRSPRLGGATNLKKDGAAPRKSSRDRKQIATYNEDIVYKEIEKPKPGSYISPKSPAGMKPSAYLCKYPSARGPNAEVLSKRMGLPKRNQNGHWTFPDHPEFRPNLSPADVLKDGAFGGTYFRKIKSFVTGQVYEDAWKELPQEWIKGLNPARQLAASTYNPAVNKWKVAADSEYGCAGTADIDPFGWFQWYCRQIGRFLGVAGPKGRFRNQLMNKIVAAKVAVDDPSVSPVIRQTLHHWGCELTEDDLAAARKQRR